MPTYTIDEEKYGPDLSDRCDRCMLSSDDGYWFVEGPGAGLPGDPDAPNLGYICDDCIGFFRPVDDYADVKEILARELGVTT